MVLGRLLARRVCGRLLWGRLLPRLLGRGRLLPRRVCGRLLATAFFTAARVAFLRKTLLKSLVATLGRLLGRLDVGRLEGLGRLDVGRLEAGRLLCGRLEEVLVLVDLFAGTAVGATVVVTALV
jgi:hypothetical protein